MKYLVFFFINILLLVLIACNKDFETDQKAVTPNLPEETIAYDQAMHPNFRDTINNEIATLGRVLFYDRSLSANNSISCATCHKQHLAFSDNQAFSKGVNVKKTLRNAPPISNVFSYSSFFWDSRSNDLLEMVLLPIQDHIEMGFKDIDQLIMNLNGQPYYAELFDQAYGTSEINDERIAAALAEFLKSLSSFNSKYDIGMNSDFSNFNSKELQGKNLFFGKANCSNCHNRSSNNLEGFGIMANIGLELEYKDKGFANVTDDPINEGQFKVPGLRNVAITAPYMHDGRFSTLEEVVDHYNENVKQHKNVDWRLTEELDNLNNGDGFGWWEEPDNGGVPKPLNLTEHEKSCLVEFLKTLTDHQFLNDAKYSDPFM